MKMINYYREFNYTKLHGYDYFIINNHSRFVKIKIICKAFLKSLIIMYESKSSRIDTEFLFVKSSDRLDYNNLFNVIYQQCDYEKDVIEVHSIKRFNFYNLIHVFIYSYLNMNLIREYGFLNSIYIYIKLITYFQFFNTLKYLEHKNLVVFSDIHPIENIFVHYSNFVGITTVTMQHALFIDFKDMPNINMINYLYSSSKYLLAWGESTKNLFEMYNKDVLIEIVGKPTIYMNDNILKSNKLIGVVFDQPMLRQYNIKLLSIAYEIAIKYNMKVVLRLHPQDNKKHYILKNELISNKSNIENAQYIIAHTTSMIYEYLALGYKVFKLKSEVPSNEINDYLKFSDSKELLDKFDLTFDFQKEALNHISFIGNDSKARYRKFFNKIHKSNTNECHNTIGVTNEN